MANRRISEFPSINGTAIDSLDLLPIVHVFEVDPALRNKKLTFTELQNYLNLYYVQQEATSVTLNGLVIYDQPTPTAVDVTATLNAADLQTKIITSSTTLAVTMTLPTGTAMDAAFSTKYNNMAFEWTVINTGATNAVTVQANTGHTIVGSATVNASNSGRFVSTRSGTNVWISYRLAT